MSDTNVAATETRPLTVKEAGAQISGLRKKQSETPAPATPESEAANQPEKDTDKPAPDKVKAQKLEAEIFEEIETDVKETEVDVDEESENIEDEDVEDTDGVEDEDLDLDVEIDAEDAEDADDSEEEAELIEFETPDGETVKITAEELYNGYLRQRDYTKKTEELSKERKTIEAIQDEISDLPEVRKTYQDTAKHFGQTAGLVLKILDDKFIPNAPDPALMDTDPAEYVRRKELRQEALDFKNGIVGELQRQQNLEANFLQKEIEKGGVRLIRDYPVLKDEAEQRNLREYIKSDYGYKDEDIDVNTDHNLFIMAHKAMKYDAIIKKQKNLKPTAKKPKVLKSKKGREDKGSIQKRKRTDALNQHQKTGSVRSAANAIAEGIKSGQRKKKRR